MAEIGALLRRYTVNNRIEGSNPSVSANSSFTTVRSYPQMIAVSLCLLDFYVAHAYWCPLVIA